MVLSMDEGIVGKLLENLQPVVKADLMIDPDIPEFVHTFINNHLHAFIAVPLIIVDKAIGILEIAHTQVGKYTENDLRILQSIAFTMSVALENAQLYEDLKRSLAERERAQAYLIQSEKAAALGRLVAVVAHEINNPLQAIQGCLELFSEEMQGKNRSKKLKLYLDTVETEIDRIATIVRRMRDFYRPAQTGLSLADLSKVVLSVLELTKKQLQHNQIHVETTWSKSLPLVQANTDHLKQVFLNLIINAIDAMPNGGTLRVGIEPAIMSEESQLNIPALKITFTDTGVGISPDIINRLFEPFFTTKPSGTGLGLYVSTGIIEAHNGKIEVISQPNIGTTFHIFIPLVEKQP
jgi:two-component system NtrC family sensor kinase